MSSLPTGSEPRVHKLFLFGFHRDRAHAVLDGDLITDFGVRDGGVFLDFPFVLTFLYDDNVGLHFQHRAGDLVSFGGGESH